MPYLQNNTNDIYNAQSHTEMWIWGAEMWIW